MFINQLLLIVNIQEDSKIIETANSPFNLVSVNKLNSQQHIFFTCGV